MTPRPSKLVVVISVLLLLALCSFPASAQSNSSGAGVAVTQGGNVALVTSGGGLSVNLAQVGGNTLSTGNGTAGTGSPRVTIASDNTAFTVNSAQSGTWTVQPGNTANSTAWLTTDSGTGSTGSSVPTKAGYVGGDDSSGNLQGSLFTDSSALYDASTSGSTQLVALSSGKTIYVTGFHIFSGGTANVKLIYGTGTACATGSTNLTPAYQFTAQTGIVQSPLAFGYLLKTAASNALCINTSAGVAIQAMVFYVQR